jgi:hypothetical protein
MAEHFAVVPIRYDGLDAERHQIELQWLGESCQGIARILAVTGHFVATGQYAKQMQSLDVKVYVDEPKANCFTIHAVIDFAKDQQLFAGFGVAALGGIITWLFHKASGTRAEMKAIKDSLDKAIGLLAGQNSELVPRLLATLERMADSLRPSLRAAVAPVGRTCRTMRVGDSGVIDEPMAEAIRSLDADEVTAERSWDVRITEFDFETAHAKVRFVDDEDEGQEDRRVRAVITDPSAHVLGNPYIRAFAKQTPLRVRGKAVMKEGEIQTLYISDSG